MFFKYNNISQFHRNANSFSPSKSMGGSRSGFHLRERLRGYYYGGNKDLKTGSNRSFYSNSRNYFYFNRQNLNKNEDINNGSSKETLFSILFSMISYFILILILARVKNAWKSTPLDWTPIPIGIGLAYLAFYQLWRKAGEETDETEKPKKGPWQVQVYTSLPLKSLSRLFGLFNEITLPVWLREPSLRFYAWFFGCNLDEMADPNLRNYPNLSSFFYRQLKEGVRPIDDAILVSPADGRVLHFGEVQGSQIEQIKGVTYDINDLFGRKPFTPPQTQTAQPSNYKGKVVDHEDFANVNGIPYSLQGLFSGEEKSQEHPHDDPNAKDMNPTEVKGWENLLPGRKLMFTVIYLAPGDYHRFHSPANWVVESRRHFAGELYSVSPFIVKYLKDLFVLNERVALIGKWGHGFFSMLPVGATNVGSIKIHFDEDLKTNERNVTHRGTYTQVSYAKASPLLGGYPLETGQEIGGFCLGSTIVLVFEAPENFEFNIEANQKVRVGQALGKIVMNKPKDE